MRLRLLALVVCAAFSAVGSANAEFPEKPVRLVVGNAPGSNVDLAARVVALKMQDVLKQTVIVENRAGVNGVVAASAVLSADPDGYTLLFANGAVLSSTFIKTPTFDPLKDLQPIGPVLTGLNGVMVNAQLPVKTFNEFIAYAKANPGKLNAATFSASSGLMLEAFLKATGTNMAKIDYKGNGQAQTALVANEVQFAISSPRFFKQFLDEGKARLLAVVSEKSVPAFPGVPGLGEVGVSELNGATLILALWTRTGTPESSVKKLNEALVSALKQAEVITKFESVGLDPVVGSPAEMRAMQIKESNFWAETAKAANFKPE